MRAAGRPYSRACEENRGPILEVLAPLLAGARNVLEIGSGTGQHAVAFAAALPHLLWQTSDVAEAHPGIRMWIEGSGLDNVLPPLALDVTGAWPRGLWDAVFSANTAHIMSVTQLEAMFRGVPGVLGPGGLFALYGPFNYDGCYTSDSNARFDAWLRARDPASGIREFDHLNALAGDNGLELVEDYAMPANNRIVLWRRRGRAEDRG